MRGIRMAAVWTVLCAAWAVGFSPLEVQVNGQMRPAPRPGVEAVEMPGVDAALPMAIVGAQAIDAGEPIAGKPFSAQTEIEMVQLLPDGNRIVRRFTGALHRDSAGRTRREQAVAAVGVLTPGEETRTVVINDPVAGISLALDVASRTAARGPLLRLERAAVAAVASQLARQSARVPSKGIPNVTVESLGTAMIEGLVASGTRTTFTIPSGAIGNEQPIRVVSETSQSEELGILVASRRFDPRFGETRYELRQIVRTEPSSELFQVPDGYHVTSLPPPGSGGDR